MSEKCLIALIAFLTNLWYSSMASYDGDMAAVNYKQKKSVEEFITLASDHRIFLQNWSFRVHWHVH